MGEGGWKVLSMDGIRNAMERIRGLSILIVEIGKCGCCCCNGFCFDPRIPLDIELYMCIFYWCWKKGIRAMRSSAAREFEI